MPIGGVVITSRPEETVELAGALARLANLEIHGRDASGNIVAVLDTASSEEMERLIDRINRDQRVLGVGLTYLNTEDEAARLQQGEPLAKPFGFRKSLARDV